MQNIVWDRGDLFADSVLLSLKVRYYGNYCANIDEKYHIINTVSSHAVSPLSRSTGLSVSCC